jgi:hypothetical protein
MATFVPKEESRGQARFALSLLLIVPAILSFLASAAISRNTEFPASSLWFVYQVSWYIGMVGTAIVVGMTVTAAVRRGASDISVWLMGIVAAAGIFLVWYASHIYKTPWYT